MYDLLFQINESGKKNDLSSFELCLIPMIIVKVIIIPIIEELFFRKFLIMKIKFNALLSILISSLLFSLVHLNYIHKSYIALFGGLISGYIYHKTDKVIYSILFHISWNFLVHYSKYYYVPFIQ